MKELSSKALAVGASLMTASIIAGFSFIKDVESRLAIIEDDLGETVEVVGMLHPPSRASLSVESETFYADNKKKKRKKTLDRLREQAKEKEKKEPKKKNDEEKMKYDSQVNVVQYR